MMTGLLVFFFEGSAAQIMLGMLISIFSALMYVKYNPYIDSSDNLVSHMAQLSVFLVLMVVLARKVNVAVSGCSQSVSILLSYFSCFLSIKLWFLTASFASYSCYVLGWRWSRFGVFLWGCPHSIGDSGPVHCLWHSYSGIRRRLVWCDIWVLLWQEKRY